VGQLSGTIHPTYGSTRARACCPAAVEGRQKGRGEAQKKGRGKGKGESHITSKGDSAKPIHQCSSNQPATAMQGIRPRHQCTPLASTVEIHVRHFFSLARCKGGGGHGQELNGVNSRDGGVLELHHCQGGVRALNKRDMSGVES